MHFASMNIVTSRYIVRKSITNCVFYRQAKCMIDHNSQNARHTCYTSTPMAASEIQATYYDTLGVPTDATGGQIRSAYVDKCKQCHPDKNIGGRICHRNFTRIQEAYSVLSKPSSRHEYDEHLRSCQHHRSLDDFGNHNSQENHDQGPRQWREYEENNDMSISKWMVENLDKRYMLGAGCLIGIHFIRECFS